MNTDKIISHIKSRVCSEVEIEKEGMDRYLIHTPFTFDDGDVFKIILKDFEKETPFLTDEGHTLMHLSYKDVEVESGTRSELFSNILNRHSIVNNDGEMRLYIIDRETVGDAVFSFLQGISNISDLDFLKRERIRSMFYEDARKFLAEKLSEFDVHFDKTIEGHDEQGLYPVDCCVRSDAGDIFIFPILNDDKCRDTTISLLQFEKYGVDFRSIGIFQNQEEINRKVLSRFSDVCDKQFSTLDSARDRIQKVIGSMT